MNDPSTMAESAWVRFEDVIHRFEEAWRRGERPDIDSFLTDHNAVDRRVLLELVHVDLEFRLRADEEARAEEYLTKYPQLSDDKRTAVDLITAEYALRRRWRSGANRDDFLKRFPDLALELSDRLNAVETMGNSRQRSSWSLGPADTPELPGFAIQKEVGRGGMGIVYRALDLRLNRVVAVKTLAGGAWAAASERERFRHEAEAIAHLDHPNIVPVYEVGEYEGLPFFSMKYFAGGSLAQHERGRHSDPQKIVELVKVVAGAVHHAHLRGVLHRDLKPSNILLDEEGRPHVTDFGLAKRFDPQTGPLDASTIAGTPAYMAPEQAAGKGDLTTATDVYGLGAILYELLTGAKPFTGDSPLRVLQLLSEQPPKRPTALNPKVPRDLETITLKCLEKNPAHRYASAADLAADLQRWRGGEPIHARPVSAWERSWRTVRRHPVVSGLILATTLAMMFAMITLAISRERIQTALAQEKQATIDLAEALEREREHLYHERVTNAWRLWSANHAQRAEELLEMCPPRFRRWEWFLLDKHRRQDFAELGGGRHRLHAVRYSPSGKHIAIGDARGVVALHDAADGLLVREFSGTSSSVAHLAFHPEETLLAAIIGREAHVWNIADGTKVLQRPAHRWLAFSPDGQSMAMGLENRVVILDVPSFQERHILNGHTNVVPCGHFNAAGQLATGGIDRTVRVWDVNAGTELHVVRTLSQPVNSLAWVFGTNRLIIGQFFELVIMDPFTGKELERITETERGQLGLCVSADGKRMAYVLSNGTIRVRDMTQGHDVQSLHGQPSPIAAMDFDAAGLRLATVGSAGPARIWKLGPTTEGRLLSAWNQITGLSFSPDGTMLAAARFFPPSGSDQENDKVLVIDVATGQTLAKVPGFHEVAFGPNGKWIAAVRANGSVSAYDVATGGELWNQAADTHRAGRLAISKTGRLAVGATNGDILIWEKPGQSQPALWKHHAAPITGLSFSGDGQRLVVGDRDGHVSVFDAAGQIARTWHDDNTIMTVAITADGQRVAVSGGGKVIRLWNVASGEELTPCHGHINQVLTLAFSPDGRRLVSGGLDSQARLWDVAAGREILSLPGHRGVVHAAAFSPDGRAVVASGYGLKIWETDDGPHCP
jgi:WD40 repeat protein